MNMEQLKYFLTIEKLKNFSKASEELCVSQSSISKQIKSLENELNTILFKRTTRNLVLTPSGEKFKEFSKTTLNNYENLLSDLKNNIEKVSVATIPVISQYKIASLIHDFKIRYPNIDVEIKEMEHNHIIPSIKNFQTNIAFIRTENLLFKNLDIVELLNDELVLVTSKKHPLAKRKYASLEDFKNDKFILLGKSSGVYNSSIKACKDAGFTPNISYSNSRIESIIGLVEQNLGITLVMANVIRYFNNPNLNIIFLKTPIKSTLGIISLKDKALSKMNYYLKTLL